MLAYILSLFPDLNTIPGLLVYGIVTYIITMLIVSCINSLVAKNIDIESAKEKNNKNDRQQRKHYLNKDIQTDKVNMILNEQTHYYQSLKANQMQRLPKEDETTVTQQIVDEQPDESSLIVKDTIRQNCRKNYGNIIVCLDNPFFISLGPDYWCFLPTFISFLITSFLILNLVFVSTESILAKVVSLTICFGYILSYLLMAISNPGIAHQNVPGSHKLCKKCNLYVERTTQHCRDCNVCIIEYDHHCPWTSKCIGKNNLKRFYIFLGLTPVFLVFCMIATIVCLADTVNSGHIVKIE